MAKHLFSRVDLRNHIITKMLKEGEPSVYAASLFVITEYQTFEE